MSTAGLSRIIALKGSDIIKKSKLFDTEEESKVTKNLNFNMSDSKWKQTMPNNQPFEARRKYLDLNLAEAQKFIYSSEEHANAKIESSNSSPNIVDVSSKSDSEFQISRNWSESDLHSATVKTIFTEEESLESAKTFWAEHLSPNNNRDESSTSGMWILETPTLIDNFNIPQGHEMTQTILKCASTLPIESFAENIQTFESYLNSNGIDFDANQGFSAATTPLDLAEYDVSTGISVNNNILDTNNFDQQTLSVSEDFSYNQNSIAEENLSLCFKTPPSPSYTSDSENDDESVFKSISTLESSYSKTNSFDFNGLSLKDNIIPESSLSKSDKTSDRLMNEENNLNLNSPGKKVLGNIFSVDQSIYEDIGENGNDNKFCTSVFPIDSISITREESDINHGNFSIDMNESELQYLPAETQIFESEISTQDHEITFSALISETKQETLHEFPVDGQLLKSELQTYNNFDSASLHIEPHRCLSLILPDLLTDEYGPESEDTLSDRNPNPEIAYDDEDIICENNEYLIENIYAGDEIISIGRIPEFSKKHPKLKLKSKHLSFISSSSSDSLSSDSSSSDSSNSDISSSSSSSITSSSSSTESSTFSSEDKKSFKSSKSRSSTPTILPRRGPVPRRKGKNKKSKSGPVIKKITGGNSKFDLKMNTEIDSGTKLKNLISDKVRKIEEIDDNLIEIILITSGVAISIILLLIIINKFWIVRRD